MSNHRIFVDCNNSNNSKVSFDKKSFIESNKSLNKALDVDILSNCKESDLKIDDFQSRTANEAMVFDGCEQDGESINFEQTNILIKVMNPKVPRSHVPSANNSYDYSKFSAISDESHKNSIAIVDLK